MMFSKSITALVLLASKAAATIYYAGVAESGGEFGVYSRKPEYKFNKGKANLRKVALRHLELGCRAGLASIMNSSVNLPLMFMSIRTRSMPSIVRDESC
jgi:hypothetical protein